MGKGDESKKQEEVFFNGAWGAIDDYIKEIEGVQASLMYSR